MCGRKEDIHRLFGGDSEKEPPVPIPNTEVKLLSAESTCLDTDRKDRTPPNFYSSLAQSVEPAAVNRVVVGSSPTGGAKQSLSRTTEAFVLSKPKRSEVGISSARSDVYRHGQRPCINSTASV